MNTKEIIFFALVVALFSSSSCKKEKTIVTPQRTFLATIDDGSTVQRFVYDSENRLTKYEWSRATDGISVDVTSFDANGRILELLQSGSFTTDYFKTTFNYNSSGKLVQEANARSNSRTGVFTTHNIIDFNYPSPTKTFKVIKNPNTNTIIGSSETTIDANGNKTSEAYYTGSTLTRTVRYVGYDSKIGILSELPTSFSITEFDDNYDRRGKPNSKNNFLRREVWEASTGLTTITNYAYEYNSDNYVTKVIATKTIPRGSTTTTTYNLAYIKK